MSEKEVSLPQSLSKDEEAYAWVVRVDSDQCTRQDQLRFDEWLEADENNPARFEEAFALWTELGALKGNSEALAALGDLYEANPLQDNEPPASRRVSRRTWLGGGLAALAATLGGVLVLPDVLRSSGTVLYSTAKGEQRRVVLADGSTVVLDTATRIHVEFEDAQRLVTLEHGQAFFDVAHDPSRPFRVFAGQDEIRALGTAFEVRYEGGAARVILEEGRVAVFRGGAAVRSAEILKAGATRAKADIVLDPGQSAELVPAAAVEPKVAEVDLAQTNAWRDGEMVFDDVSLAEAVAEVNRYGGRSVVLGDPGLAKLRVSGTFHTNRPEAFVEGVTAALPVRLQQSDASKLVLKEI